MSLWAVLGGSCEQLPSSSSLAVGPQRPLSAPEGLGGLTQRPLVWEGLCPAAEDRETLVDRDLPVGTLTQFIPGTALPEPPPVLRSMPEEKVCVRRTAPERA